MVTKKENNSQSAEQINLRPKTKVKNFTDRTVYMGRCMSNSLKRAKINSVKLTKTFKFKLVNFSYTTLNFLKMEIFSNLQSFLVMFFNFLTELFLVAISIVSKSVSKLYELVSVSVMNMKYSVEFMFLRLSRLSMYSKDAVVRFFKASIFICKTSVVYLVYFVGNATSVAWNCFSKGSRCVKIKFTKFVFNVSYSLKKYVITPLSKGAKFCIITTFRLFQYTYEYFFVAMYNRLIYAMALFTNNLVSGFKISCCYLVFGGDRVLLFTGKKKDLNNEVMEKNKENIELILETCTNKVDAIKSIHSIQKDKDLEKLNFSKKTLDDLKSIQKNKFNLKIEVINKKHHKKLFDIEHKHVANIQINESELLKYKEFVSSLSKCQIEKEENFKNRILNMKSSYIESKYALDAKSLEKLKTYEVMYQEKKSFINEKKSNNRLARIEKNGHKNIVELSKNKIRAEKRKEATILRKQNNLDIQKKYVLLKADRLNKRVAEIRLIEESLLKVKEERSEFVFAFRDEYNRNRLVIANLRIASAESNKEKINALSLEKIEKIKSVKNDFILTFKFSQEEISIKQKEIEDEKAAIFKELNLIKEQRTAKIKEMDLLIQNTNQKIENKKIEEKEKVVELLQKFNLEVEEKRSLIDFENRDRLQNISNKRQEMKQRIEKWNSEFERQKQVQLEKELLLRQNLENELALIRKDVEKKYNKELELQHEKIENLEKLKLANESEKLNAINEYEASLRTYSAEIYQLEQLRIEEIKKKEIEWANILNDKNKIQSESIELENIAKKKFEENQAKLNDELELLNVQKRKFEQEQREEEKRLNASIKSAKVQYDNEKKSLEKEINKCKKSYINEERRIIKEYRKIELQNIYEIKKLKNEKKFKEEQIIEEERSNYIYANKQIKENEEFLLNEIKKLENAKKDENERIELEQQKLLEFKMNEERKFKTSIEDAVQETNKINKQLIQNENMYKEDITKIKQNYKNRKDEIAEENRIKIININEKYSVLKRKFDEELSVLLNNQSKIDSNIILLEEKLKVKKQEFEILNLQRIETEKAAIDAHHNRLAQFELSLNRINDNVVELNQKRETKINEHNEALNNLHEEFKLKELKLAEDLQNIKQKYDNDINILTENHAKLNAERNLKIEQRKAEITQILENKEKEKAEYLCLLQENLERKRIDHKKCIDDIRMETQLKIHEEEEKQKELQVNYETKISELTIQKNEQLRMLSDLEVERTALLKVAEINENLEKERLEKERYLATEILKTKQKNEEEAIEAQKQFEGECERLAQESKLRNIQRQEEEKIALDLINQKQNELKKLQQICDNEVEEAKSTLRSQEQKLDKEREEFERKLEKEEEIYLKRLQDFQKQQSKIQAEREKEYAKREADEEARYNEEKRKYELLISEEENKYSKLYEQIENNRFVEEKKFKQEIEEIRKKTEELEIAMTNKMTTLNEEYHNQINQVNDLKVDVNTISTNNNTTLRQITFENDRMLEEYEVEMQQLDKMKTLKNKEMIASFEELYSQQNVTEQKNRDENLRIKHESDERLFQITQEFNKISSKKDENISAIYADLSDKQKIEEEHKQQLLEDLNRKKEQYIQQEASAREQRRLQKEAQLDMRRKHDDEIDALKNNRVKLHRKNQEEINNAKLRQQSQIKQLRFERMKAEEAFKIKQHEYDKVRKSKNPYN